jgi:hypothetical protein
MSDEKLRNVNPAAKLNDRQLRFLDAYRERLVIAAAARLAFVHRATVYRWMRDPAFAAALQGTAEEFFRAHKAKVLAAEATREAWRSRRERERWPMRCSHLARAREAKCRPATTIRQGGSGANAER